MWSQWIISGDISRRMNHSGRHPSKGLVIRTLKDGYWDRTEVIELPEGGRRVRKRTKGAAFGPWGVESLRREIRYLACLPERTAAVFPPVLAAWDNESGAAPDVGYEMPFSYATGELLALRSEWVEVEESQVWNPLTEQYNIWLA